MLPKMASSSHSSEECSRLMFEAVNENSTSKFALAKSTYSVIEILTSLIQRNDNGEIPLVVAMKNKFFSVIDELIHWMSANNAYSNEDFGPMFLIIINEIAHHIPLMELIEYQIKDLNCCSDDLDNELGFQFIGQVFINSNAFTRQDKIIALELLGAINFFNTNPLLGMICWEEAMNLRYFPQDSDILYPKELDVYVPSETFSIVFGSAVEVMSVEELNLLQEDYMDSLFSPLNSQLFDRRIKIQALLVIRRISVQANLEHLHWLYLESLYAFGRTIFKQSTSNFSGDGKIVMNTCQLILEQMDGFASRKFFNVFLKTLRLTSRFFLTTVLKNPPNSPERGELSFTNLMIPTKFITSIKYDHFDSCDGCEEPDRQNFLAYVCFYLFLLNYISPQLTNEEKQKLEEHYSLFIRNFSPERTTTVLHLAVLGNYRIDNTQNNEVPQTVKLILKLGADPKAIDEKGRTPLHILAGFKKLHLEEYMLVFKELVDAESHLDSAADDGETVISLLKRTLMEYGDNFVHPPYFESLINTVHPLSCYAARVIRRHGIPFDGDRIPVHLQSLVACHSAKDFDA